MALSAQAYLYHICTQCKGLIRVSFSPPFVIAPVVCTGEFHIFCIVSHVFLSVFYRYVLCDRPNETSPSRQCSFCKRFGHDKRLCPHRHARQGSPGKNLAVGTGRLFA